MGTKKSAAARRARRSRAQLRETWGGAAYRVVRAYCDRRIELGLPPVDASVTGALAGQCMRLLDGRSWDEPTLRDAAVRFADTRRFPGYFNEWASQIVTEREIAEHEAKKGPVTGLPKPKEPKPDRGLRSIADILGRAVA